MRKNIETLIAAGVTGYQVAKDTDLPKNTAYRIFKGEASLDNISLKNAEILNDYFLRLKVVNTPVIDRVYQADNGDVFIKHKNLLQEMSLINVYELKQLAIELLKNNEVVQCKSVELESYGLNHTNYYTLEDEFIATSDMHVRDNFEPMQDFIYLYRSSEKSTLGQFIENFERLTLVNKSFNI